MLSSDLHNVNAKFPIVLTELFEKSSLLSDWQLKNA